MAAAQPGGFLLSCRRVFKSPPVPTNLEIPPHKYRADGPVTVGENGNTARGLPSGPQATQKISPEA